MKKIIGFLSIISISEASEKNDVEDWGPVPIMRSPRLFNLHLPSSLILDKKAKHIDIKPLEVIPEEKED